MTSVGVNAGTAHAQSEEEYRQSLTTQLLNCRLKTRDPVLDNDLEIDLSFEIASDGALKDKVRRASGGWLSRDRQEYLRVASRLVTECEPFPPHDASSRQVSVLIGRGRVSVAQITVRNDDGFGVVESDVAPKNGNAVPVSRHSSSTPEAEAMPARKMTQNDPVELKARLLRCFEGSDDISIRESLWVEFTIGEDGTIVGLPGISSGQAVNDDARKLYVATMSALDACSPFAASGAKADFKALVDRTGPKMILALQGGAQKPSPSQNSASAVLVVPKPTATEEDEKKLDLSRAARRELQNRLRISGHNPGGSDGVFGPNTRRAITEWQTASGFGESGFFNRVQISRLQEMTEAKYQEFVKSQPKVNNSKNRKKRKRRRLKVCGPKVLGVRFCHYE
ncbi:MAG: peptidoglycan-binding protein, partial [Rhizobiaceae bacterium]|nr:peptidoglycan-binding protein [Rhizobiaceae bacterium]